MAKVLPVGLVGAVTTVSTKLNYTFVEATRALFYGTTAMSEDEIRQDISKVALELSLKGFHCSYDGYVTLEVTNPSGIIDAAVYDTLTAKIYKNFTSTISKDGNIFLIKKNPKLSHEEMLEVAGALSSKFIVSYDDGNNFLVVSTTPRLSCAIAMNDENEKNFVASV